MSTAVPDPALVDEVDPVAAPGPRPSGMVALADDEYDVALPPGQHRGHSEYPDPVRVAQTLTEGLAQRLGQGLVLLRGAAGLGFRLVGLGRMPLQLATGPLGRGQQQAVTPDRPPVAVRSIGEDVELTPEEVAEAFPSATDRLVVFVPALGEEESVWRTAADQLGASYGSRLAGLLDWTPVLLRADDSVGIGATGVETSALLQRLVDCWPVPVRRVVLIGHGTGGLVARGALGVVAMSERPWTDLVTELIALGTPHLAAPPQRGTREIGRQLDERLAGIVADETLVDVPPLQGVRYVLISDRVTSSPTAASRILGDLLWWRQRATLRPRRARDLFPTAERHEVGTADSPLVNHPEIHNALLLWLA